MTDFAVSLMHWYQEHARKLPWRETSDPYLVWVSEIMLQQTRVDTVIPYYYRFIGRFPTVQALAGADEEAYLKLWEGLGYYSRVRNLIKGAKYVVEHHGGILPKNREELLKIPGIGPYTAAAILSIAYGQQVAAVDGNLMRVYARTNALEVRPDDEAAKRECAAYLQSHMDEENAQHFNQALMDIGELVCLPNGEPHCNLCPFQGLCKAHLAHKETSYPLPKKRVEKAASRLLVIVGVYQGKLWIRKRPEKGLLGGMYEFPHVDIPKGKDASFALKNCKIPCKNPLFLANHKHIFTHLVWEMEGYVVELMEAPEEGLLASLDECRFRYTLPNAFASFLNAFVDKFGPDF